MGRAERRAGTELPPCPKCGPTPAAELARDGENARFQCAKCLDVYLVPARSVPSHPAAAAPAAAETSPPDPGGGETLNQGQEPKESDVAKDLCWCGRDGGHSGKHRGKKAGAKAKPAKPPRGAAELSRKLDRFRKKLKDPDAGRELLVVPDTDEDPAAAAAPSLKEQVLKLLRGERDAGEARAEYARRLIEHVGEFVEEVGGG